MDLLQGTQILGNLGEFFGAVAVLATLVYVAIQVRQTRVLIAGQVDQSSFALQAQYLEVVAASDAVSHLIVKGRRSLAALSEEERLRFSCVLSLGMNFIEHSFRQSGSTVHDPGRQSLSALVNYFLKDPGGREYWQSYRPLYTSQFASWVDEQLQRHDAQDATESARRLRDRSPAL